MTQPLWLVTKIVKEAQVPLSPMPGGWDNSGYVEELIDQVIQTLLCILHHIGFGFRVSRVWLYSTVLDGQSVDSSGSVEEQNDQVIGYPSKDIGGFMALGEWSISIWREHKSGCSFEIYLCLC